MSLCRHAPRIFSESTLSYTMSNPQPCSSAFDLLLNLLPISLDTTITSAYLARSSLLPQAPQKILIRTAQRPHHHCLSLQHPLHCIFNTVWLPHSRDLLKLITASSVPCLQRLLPATCSFFPQEDIVVATTYSLPCNASSCNASSTLQEESSYATRL